MEEKALCVIPARYASTRLPGKPLKDIAGQPMICRVYDRAKKAQRTAATIVAPEPGLLDDPAEDRMAALGRDTPPSR